MGNMLHGSHFAGGLGLTELEWRLEGSLLSGIKSLQAQIVH